MACAVRLFRSATLIAVLLCTLAMSVAVVLLPEAIISWLAATICCAVRVVLDCICAMLFWVADWLAWMANDVCACSPATPSWVCDCISPRARLVDVCACVCICAMRACVCVWVSTLYLAIAACLSATPNVASALIWATT